MAGLGYVLKLGGLIAIPKPPAKHGDLFSNGGLTADDDDDDRRLKVHVSGSINGLVRERVSCQMVQL